MSNDTKVILTIQDTNVLKGLAICLMLIHHLFWVRNGLFNDIHLAGEHYLVCEIGKMSKVCVAVFVFLSGYGLMMQSEKRGGFICLREFYFHRFKKLFLNYWFIIIAFVPISYFCFGMTFKRAYQTDLIGWHIVTDLFGLHSLFYKDIYCYNPTWWFYSCIIMLYLLYPLMYKMMRRDELTLLLLSLIISFLPIPLIEDIQFNIVSFALGMLLASSKNASPNLYAKRLLLLLLILFAINRNFNSYPLMIDCILALLIVQIYQMFRCPNVVKRVMSFLGKHSMNIFLFHTFIFGFWFQDFIYWSRNPIIIFFTLLFVCIPISMLLELIKKYTIYRI